MRTEGSSSAPWKNHLFKIILIGDSTVGKSQILSRYTKNKFSIDSNATKNAEFGSRGIVLEHEPVTVQICATGGQERYRALTISYFSGAHGAMLVYDITKRESFENISGWLRELRRTVDRKMVILLIGNKTDLENQRDVPTEHAQKYARRKKLIFFETSALEAINIDTAVLTIVNEMFKMVFKKHLPFAYSTSPHTYLPVMGIKLGNSKIRVNPQEEDGGFGNTACSKL
ncbi:ras-related protein Rab11D-like [Telopea speciosissima]|uniref:ras-related protein Rab11D-like n=1 Tax=Telopea speciosissima TaxID=54955 RepID=UPI001CC5275D|nr:ras-related protein Rab11D-like [Telopea speciosissima]